MTTLSNGPNRLIIAGRYAGTPVVKDSFVRRIAALLLLALVSAGCFGEDLPTVTTAPVEAAEVTQTVSAPASVEAAAKQDVAARISGVVTRVAVPDGKRVRRGDLVLRLSSEQVELAQDQADAARSAAAGVAGVAVDGNGDATRDATSDAVAQLDRRTKPRLEQARRRARRIDDRDQREAALAAVDAVEASYLSTRQALLTAGHTLAEQQDATAQSLSRALNDALAGATAGQRAQAEAAGTIAAEQARQLRVTAPFAGTLELGSAAASDGGQGLPAGLGGAEDLAGAAGALGALGGGGSGDGGTLRVGAPVTVGQTLFSVYDLSSFHVLADVDEVDAPQVKVGQRATVLIDAFPEGEFEAVVERVQVAAETTAAGGVGYPVRLRLLEPPRGVRVGMTASVEISTKTQNSERVVPSRALLRENDKTVVYVVRDGTIEIVPVKVQTLGEETAAIAGGVTADDQVVVAGYEDLADGDRVQTE